VTNFVSKNQLVLDDISRFSLFYFNILSRLFASERTLFENLCKI